MKFVVIGVYDKVLDAFMPAQCIQPMLDEDIIESHRRSVIAGQLDSKKAQAYDLIKYGEFDDKTGSFDILVKPVKLCSLGDFLPKKVELQEAINGSAN